MSEQNFAVVREVLDAWNRADIDAVIAHAAEDFEWHPALVESVEGEAFRGHDGFRRFLDDWASTWESWELEAEEMREFGEQVLVLTHVKAKGRGSGIAIDQPFAHLFEFDGDLICRAQTFFDRNEAIAFAEGRRQAA
jgi:ketosteroid isomerase-like protein